METAKYINEVWRPVVGYYGLYEVSNFGRVRSLARTTIRRGRVNALKEKILKNIDRGNGYNSVVLSKNYEKTTYNVHNLVAQAFLPNPNNYPCINHKDCNKKNNSVWVNPDGSVDPEKSNLEWCTYQYNNTYADKGKLIGLKRAKPIIQYTLDGVFVKKWDGGQSEAARELNLSQAHIGACCLGKRKSHGDYRWTFEN